MSKRSNMGGHCPECGEASLWYERGFPQTLEMPEELPEVYCLDCEWRADDASDWLNEEG